MTQANPDKVISALLKRALLRETTERLKTGLQLYDGRWLTEQECRTARRTKRAKLGRETIEALLIWGLGALVGVGLMLVTVMVI